MVKQAAEYRLLHKTMKTGRFQSWREEFSEPPIGVFACSKRYHRRVFLGLKGHGVDGNAWTNPIVANFRYAAWVRGATNNLDGGGDYAVRLADLETGEILGSFWPYPASEHDGVAGSVSALALSKWGSIGWIEDSLWTDSVNRLTVWMRTTGRPTMLASAPDIDPRRLRFGETGSGPGLIWSTGNSVTNFPGT